MATVMRFIQRAKELTPMGNQGKGRRAHKGTQKSQSSRASSANRNQQRNSSGQDSRKVHDTKGKNKHGRRKGGGWGILG